MKRNSSDYELGVGRIIYLQGKGKFKEYENLECLYAVELNDGLSVIKQKCKFKQNRILNLVLKFDVYVDKFNLYF